MPQAFRRGSRFGAKALYRGFLLSVVGALFAAHPVNAQQVSWIHSSIQPMPPGECCVGMAFDFVNNGSLLFGGSYSGGAGTSNETWLWNEGWSRLSPTHYPPPLQGPGMAWDGAARNIVLFGGTDNTGTFRNDTWIWNGTDWTQVFPPVSPSARRFDCQAMIYDAATRRVMFFGGITGNDEYSGETWGWDGVARTWTQYSPATSPSPRRTMLAYDYDAKEVVLFGGDTVTEHVNDTWVWNGVNWKQAFPVTSPPARTMGAMYWDSIFQRVVLFGGAGAVTLNDTWLWKYGNWTQAIAVGAVPMARWAAGADYDSNSKSLLLFGGFTFISPLNDTWLLYPGSAAAALE